MILFCLLILSFLACAPEEKPVYPPDTVIGCPAGGVAFTGARHNAELVEAMLCDRDACWAAVWSWSEDWIAVACDPDLDTEAVILWRWKDE